MKRTKKGNVTAEARAEYGTVGDRFPIFDKRSALSALKLRGHGNITKQERARVVNKAAKFVPEAARAAREVDQRRSRRS
jgi:hypothetical protein